MARSPIVIELDDTPVQLQIRGTVYSLRGDVGSEELMRTMAPFIDQAEQLQAGDVPVDEAVQVIADVMAVLGGFLIDQNQADDWNQLDLPQPAFLQVVSTLVEAWTGQSFRLPAS